MHANPALPALSFSISARNEHAAIGPMLSRCLSRDNDLLFFALRSKRSVQLLGFHGVRLFQEGEPEGGGGDEGGAIMP